MTLEKRGIYWYGDDHQDIRGELMRYSDQANDPIDAFVDIQCPCGGDTFRLLSDEDEGAAQRRCLKCGVEHLMGDSEEFLEYAELHLHECVCEQGDFQISVGVRRFRNEDDSLTDDVRWLFIGCRCPACGLIGCYADWKNEFHGFQELLRKM